MSRLGRRAARLVMLSGGLMLGGGLVAVGATGVVAGSVQAATPSNPTTTPAPQTTTTTVPPPPQTPPPTAAPTTTTIPYPTTVKADCEEFRGDEQLANRLDQAKNEGEEGSTHLVILARECGVMFSDEAEVDPDLDRPWSNLEYAVEDGNDPFYTSAWDAVTANPAQKEIVREASTEQWYKDNPDLVPETTAPPTTAAAPTTVASTVPTSTTDNVTTETTDADDRDDDSDDEERSDDDEDSTTGSPLWQIVGVLILGVGFALWGISTVRREPNES